MNWLETTSSFVAIVEYGSFAEAARRKYTSSSALSKQISWLEDHLKQQLLHRTTRHLSLTDAGQRFYQQAKKILYDIGNINAELRAQSDEVSGHLRITCPVATSRSMMTHYVPEFLKHNPKISIELVPCNTVRDLAAEGFDLALRREGSYRPSNNIDATKIAEVNHGVFASPGYIKKFGRPKTPQALQQHNCLTRRSQLVTTGWCFREDTHISVKGNYSSSSEEMLIQAAIRGLGIIYTTDFLVKSYVDQGRLLLLLEDYLPPSFNLLAIYPKRQHQSKALIKFLDYLVQQKFNAQTELPPRECALPIDITH